MSMEMSDINQMGGGGGWLAAVIAAMMGRRDDDKTPSTMMIVLAVIFFVIIFIIAIIALAMFNRDNRKGVGSDGIGEVLAATIAAKGIGCNDNGNYHHDEIAEVKNQIAHLEDRRVAADTQKELYNSTLTAMKEFGDIKSQLGMQSQALAQVLQVQNNEAIVSSVINRLRGCA